MSGHAANSPVSSTACKQTSAPTIPGWHGYRLYLWPMLERLQLDTMRFVGAGLLVVTLIFFFCALRAALGTTPAIALFVVLMSLTDIWRIWRICPHLISMIVILAGSAAFAYATLIHRNIYVAVALAAVLGAVFNFFDFLINPPMQPMLLSFFVIAIWKKEHALTPLAAAALVALAWFGGYSLTWATKWCLAVWLADDKHEMSSDIISQILLRLYGQEKDGPVRIVPLWPTIQMIAKSFVSGGVVIVMALAAAIFIHVRDHWNSFERDRFVQLMLPTLIPIVWFEILSNHTQTHQNFTYRSEAAALAITFAAWIMASGAPTTTGLLWQGLRASFKTRAQ